MLHGEDDVGAEFVVLFEADEFANFEECLFDGSVLVKEEGFVDDGDIHEQLVHFYYNLIKSILLKSIVVQVSG